MYVSLTSHEEIEFQIEIQANTRTAFNPSLQSIVSRVWFGLAMAMVRLGLARPLPILKTPHSSMVNFGHTPLRYITYSQT